jgi:hypothetical protein
MPVRRVSEEFPVIRNRESIHANREFLLRSREILGGNAGLQGAAMEPTHPSPSSGER